MKFIVFVLLLLVAGFAGAQQPSELDQADMALSIERQAANTALSVKNARIAALAQERDALKKELEKAKADAAKCSEKPK